MATLATTNLTIADIVKRLDPETKRPESAVVELLAQNNQMLEDITWMKANNGTSHRVTVRTGLPATFFRKINQGTPSSKSTTVQIDEATGELTARSQVDKTLLNLFGGAGSEARMTEVAPFIEAMNQTMQQTLIYGDDVLAPEKFVGLAPRYDTISGATNGQNVISAGGAGTDNTSIWLVCWRDDAVHGVYADGGLAGVQHLPIKDGSGDGCVDALDSDGNPYRAYVDEWKWSCGLVVRDWRYVVRIANIDSSNLAADSSAADLFKYMVRALYRLPNLNGKVAFYANRTVHSAISVQAYNKSVNAVKIHEAISQFGGPMKELRFENIPIRCVDQILNNESTIS